MAEKEFLYVGFYIDVNNNFILKIGTTNDLKRRKQEHTRNYKKASNFKMPQNSEFTYLWFLPLSKYNTLRYEDKNRESIKEKYNFKFIRNDRFYVENKPDFIDIKIKKTYRIAI